MRSEKDMGPIKKAVLTEEKSKYNIVASAYCLDSKITPKI